MFAFGGKLHFMSEEEACLCSISILRYSSLYVVRLEFLYVETAISLWWDSSLTSLKLFGTGSAERISNHSIDRMRTIWDSMICLSYCRPIGNVCSKTSNFERPKKAIFESDKEISENGQRDFLKCKALTFWSEPCNNSFGKINLPSSQPTLMLRVG